MAPVPGKGRGFIILWEVPTYFPAKAAGLFFQRQISDPDARCAAGRGRGREGRREKRAAAARGEVLAAAESTHCFCASSGRKMGLGAAYLKSEGEG